MIDRTCLNCGNTFQVPYPSSRTRYCKRKKCRYAWTRKPRKERADKGARKAKWVTLECATCKKPFDVPPWAAKQRTYCSLECQPRQEGPCSVRGCTADAFSKGMCPRHYMEWRREEPGYKEAQAEYMRQHRLENLEKFKPREWRNNLRRYGITADQWQEMFDAQGGRCAICGCTENSKGHRLAVDHCHDTNIFRGLLCHSCNRGIGLLGDDPARLRAAARYLETHSDH